MNRNRKLYLIIIFCLIFCNFSLSQEQNFYPVNGYGSLKIINDSLFTFHYWESNIDTGYYKVKGDYIYLNSIIPSIKIYKTNQFRKGLFYSNFFTMLEVSNSNGCVLMKTKGKFIKDTFGVDFRFNRVKIKKGQIVSLMFDVKRSILWVNDTIHSAYLYADERLGQHVYFNHYPLLMQDGYFLPFNKDANEQFRLVNGFDFLPMKKGSKDKKYETYYSGFGHVH